MDLIPNPISPIKDIDWIVTKFHQFREEKYKRSGYKAWREIKFLDECQAIGNYYAEHGVPLFSYPQVRGNAFKVPLYVRPEWGNLTSQNIKMNFKTDANEYRPSKAQTDFLKFYHELRKETGQGEVWNGAIFRLTDLQSNPGRLALEFERGTFFDSLMCHYLLEHELVTAISKAGGTQQLSMPIRDKVASSANAVEAFCRNNVSRIGISNLMLIRGDEDNYIPLVHRRGIQSLAQGFDTISSGIFDIISTPKADFELRHKVLVEIEEEVFGNREVAKQIQRMDPYFFYKSDGIDDILQMIEDGSAFFQVTGFCIDLIRIVPEITTVLVIQDPSYRERHLHGKGRRFKLSVEHLLTSELNIPKAVNDVDDFLTHGIFTDPDSKPPSYGFDASLWTLPGGFCFYQGVKRAVNAKLL